MAEKERDSATSSKHSFSTNIEDYRVGDVIGTGATSIVYRAEYTPTREKVAIKKINLEKCSTSVEELLKEIQAMSQCQHENVVQYYTSFVHKEDLCVVMQLCEKGSLLDVLKYRMKHYKSSKSGVLDESTIATVLKEVLKALEYFHSNGQIHRDIKAGNILLAQDGSIRIADFGVSAWLAVGKDHSREHVRHTFVGTPCWMAPEVMEQVTGYDYKADIWSFGITAIELATGAAPYHKFPPMKVLMLTLQNDPPTLDSAENDEAQYKTYGKTFRKMVAQCLRKEPTERPAAKELLKHDFFTKKAKDKAHILKALEQETYISTKETKRVEGSSGRFHKNEDGKWVWSSDEESEDEVDGTETPQGKERGQLAAGIRKTLAADDPQATITSNDDDSSTLQSAAVAADSAADQKPAEQELHLVLRLRNEQRELHDIKFEFTIGRDTSQSVSHELVEAGLVEGPDLVVMAANLDKIIERYTTGQQDNSIVFRLKSGCRPNEAPCDKSLLGFAQISITQ